MYSIEWDKQTGGIILTDNISEINIPIRPVFFEELDLLGFNKYWNYPKVEEPLLWARGRDYFYQGEKVAVARGGSFYSPPEIEILKLDLNLEPVDVSKMLEKNNRLLSGLVQKSLEFIINTKKKYENKVDAFVVAFSGGKDSIVLLDLVQRVLEPDQFFVIFNDTWMEISDTYNTVEKAKEYWQHLKFYTARSTKDAVTTWKEMGPPSRIHRWCCTVHKSAPTILKIREILGKSSAKVLVFDGVRREESAKRAGYGWVTEEGKHSLQINASPILDWYGMEIYLYILRKKLPLNPAYRYGLSRVGCLACPYSSSWSEAILSMNYFPEVSHFLNILENYALKIGKPPEKIKEYIGEGKWKARAGGVGLEGALTKVKIETIGRDIVFDAENPKDDWLKWARTIGNVRLETKNKGYILKNNSKFQFEIERNDNSLRIRVSGLAEASSGYRKKFRAIFLKSAFCVGCEACIVECPSGVLKKNGDKLVIDKEKCASCGSCLELNNRACIAASSLMITKGGKEMSDKNGRKLFNYQYETFGLKEEWLELFFTNYENWEKENLLGNRQLRSLGLWLSQAEIIKDSKNFTFTKLGEKLLNIGAHSLTTWGVIWVNLIRNSSPVNWYVNRYPWGKMLSKKESVEDAISDFNIREKTAKNLISALFNLLKNSPIGKDMGLGRESNKYIYKEGWKDPVPEVVLYSLYRYAEKRGYYEFSLEELYNDKFGEGPYKAFGIEKEQLKNILRSLSVSKKEFVKINLIHDLDNIFLNKNFSAVEVIG